MYNDEYQNTVSFISVVKELKKSVWFILLFSFAWAFLALFSAWFFLTPKYSSTVDFVVTQKAPNNETQFDNQQADLKAISTYKDLLKKQVILEPVLNNIQKKDNYSGTINDLEKSIKISNNTDSQVISLKTTDKNPYVAADIANNIAEVFTKKIKKIMKVDNVTIVSKAKENTKPTFPNKTLFFIFGLIVGVFLGISFVILRFIFDNTVKDSKFLTDELKMPNLGTIYHVNHDEQSFQIVGIKDEKVSSSKNIGKRNRV